MRCLYCGKELALLKRWTGGGEFCSDAHRQRYQEEYNQLALNRLLQSKPPGEAKAKPEPKQASNPAPPAESAEQLASLFAPAAQFETPQAPVFVATEEPPPQVPEPPVAAVRAIAPAPPDVVAPADLAGFFVERPIVAVAELSQISRPDMEFLDAVSAALPNHVFEPLSAQGEPYQLDTAGLLTFLPSNRASNYTASGSRERRLEVRDFVRTAPVVEFDLSPEVETELETSSEAMDILIFPKPPQGPPAFWQEPPVAFAAPDTELGTFARLSFSATGFAGQEESVESERVGDVAAEPTELRHTEIQPEPLPESHAETPPPPLVELLSVPVPEPEPALERVKEPVPEPAAAPVPEPVVPPVIEQVVAQARPDPEPVTKPLPLVLHLAPPAKAKSIQVFASAANAVGVQIPRSTSLPIRPLIVLGPAPAKDAAPKVLERSAPLSQKTEPKKPPVAPVSIRTEKKPDQAPSKPFAKADGKQDGKPEIKENVKLKEDAKPLKVADAPSPASLAVSYPDSSDLGLPKLSLQSNPGFWGGLPVVAKIGIAAVLIAALGGLIYFSSKGGPPDVTGANSGTVIAGSVLPAGDAGWIADWGSDPGVRRTRQISILRSSQTLTDYRIEMQGQIETKAIGWVFRAADPKNFYVTKLEIVKPGLEPTVALVRFAVINGEEQAHAQLPLPMKVRRDTLYKIRFDAIGNHFTTYVQDEKVDDWTNDGVKTGGVGLYSERGEVATLKGSMNVVPLIVRK